MNQNPVSNDYKYGFFESDENYSVKLPKGLSREVVEAISKYKSEPDWMLEIRLKAYEIFLNKKMPSWGGELGGIDFQDIHYFLRASDKTERKWEDVPDDIKRTFDKIGIPEAEKKFLAGVSSQYDSEVVYHNLKGQWEDKGVIFTDTDTAVKEYPEIVKKYFGTIIPAGDNKFSALNTAVWSGGSFIYVPKGVHVDIPLQAYFRINAANAGQFERTLIIADEGSFVHYVEGCSAPIYTTNSLHSAVVEIVCLAGSRVRYTTIQNWSKNVYNLVTKRAFVYRDATMEWIDGNLGCLAEGSTVTTQKGVVEIEKINVGDEVLSYDDKEGILAFKKVIAKKFSGYQPIHSVSIGERKLQTTSNHPFYSYVYDPMAPRKLSRYALEYIRADELKKAIVPCSSIDYGEAHVLKLPTLVTEFKSKNQYSSEFLGTRARESHLKNVEKTTDSLMWLFGYWIGDGNLDIKLGVNSENVRWAKVGFSSPKKDRARDNLIKVMSQIVDKAPTERKDGVHLAWSSKELYEFFVLNGFVGHAKDKRVPKWIWSIPEKQRLSFIAGYIDADGSIKEKREFSIKSCNKDLLEDISSLLVSLGITSRIHTEFDKPKTVMIMGYECTAHGAYRLNFAVDIRFKDFVSESMKNKIVTDEKKLKYYRKVGRSQIILPESVQIADVKVSDLSEYFVPTWDIEVDGTGNFISQGFIVHNSKLTMKYPSVYLKEEGARGEVLSLAFAGKGQHQDAGAKAVHLAPNTTSLITSKSICRDGGKTSYRGFLRVNKNCYGVKSTVKCDALVLDDISISDTYPTMQIHEQDVTIGHEASVGKLGEEQLFYLMSRGLSGDQAAAMIVQGFVEPILKELPMEYAVEMNRLIQMDMEGSVG